MNKSKTLPFIGLLVVLCLCSSPFGRAFTQIPLDQQAAEKNTSQSFDLEFSKIWDEDPGYENNDSIPDVNSLVGNLTTADFLAADLQAYVGDETPTMTLDKVYVTLNMTGLWVFKDGDSIGAGDFFIKGCVNQRIDDQMTYTEAWEYDLGEFNDDEYNDTMNLPMFAGWTAALDVFIELYDDDSGSVDSFGTWDEWGLATPGDVFIDYDVNDGIGNNATARFTLTVSPEQNMTAQDLLDAYKPYLYSDVETSYDDPAEFIVGRVVEGYDAQFNETRTCLQYLYYFPYEYTGTNVFVHYWDFEMILIYLDLNGTGSIYPYRLVWDNGFYFSSSQDWIDGQDYRIYESGAEYLEDTVSVSFSEHLRPLLGESRDMSVKVDDLDPIWSADLEKWGIFEWGLPTFQATIETSYH